MMSAEEKEVTAEYLKGLLKNNEVIDFSSLSDGYQSEEIKDAKKVVKSINEAIEAKKAPTPEKIEYCEDYIDGLCVLGLHGSARAVDESLNRWCGLLLDA